MGSIMLHHNNGWVLSESLNCITSSQTDVKMLGQQENLSFKCSCFFFFELMTFAFVTPRAQKGSSTHHHSRHNSTLTADDAYKTTQSKILQKRCVVLCFKTHFAHVDCFSLQNLMLNKMMVIYFCYMTVVSHVWRQHTA